MKVDRDGELFDSPATPLPCPFCGADNLLDKSELGYGIDCMNCSATAIDVEAWNRRAPPVAIAHEAVDNWKTAFEDEARKFQAETLLTSALSRLLLGFIERHQIEHEQGPWSRGCELCRLVTESKALLAAPINIATPTASDRPVVRAEDAKDAERYRALRGHGVIFDAGRKDDGARRQFGIGLDQRADKIMADRAAPPSGEGAGS